MKKFSKLFKLLLKNGYECTVRKNKTYYFCTAKKEDVFLGFCTETEDWVYSYLNGKVC